jgi:nitrogenase subunit NifH
MSKTLVDVQLALADRINALRCVQRIVLSEEFRAIFTASSDDEKDLVVSYIEKADRKLLESWIKNQVISKSELEDLPIRDLRTLAQQVGVANYSQLSKHQLVIQIRARTNARTIIQNRATS